MRKNIIVSAIAGVLAALAIYQVVPREVPGGLVVTPDEPAYFTITAGPGPYYPKGDLNCDWFIGGPLGDFDGDGQTTFDDLPCFIECLMSQ